MSAGTRPSDGTHPSPLVNAAATSSTEEPVTPPEQTGTRLVTPAVPFVLPGVDLADAPACGPDGC